MKAGELPIIYILLGLSTITIVDLLQACVSCYDT